MSKNTSVEKKWIKSQKYIKSNISKADNEKINEKMQNTMKR